MSLRKLLKPICILVCLSSSLTLLFGCTSISDKSTPAVTTSSKIATVSTNSNAYSDKVSAPGKLPIVEKQYVYESYTPTGNRRNTDLGLDNLFTQWLEKKTNIQVKFTTVPSDYDQKLSLIMSSGDYPEIIFYTGWTKNTLMEYASKGMILPLNDLIDTYGYYWKQACEKSPALRDDLTMPDGNIYCLGRPNWQDFDAIWISLYQPYLDALQDKAPTTTDELYRLLKRFRDEDPNGNGKKDEIPLLSSTLGFDDNSFDILAYIMGSFVSGAGCGKMISFENGKAVANMVQDGYREGISYVKKLYQEGLINKDYFTIDQNQIIATTSDENHIVGGVLQSHPSNMLELVDGKAGDWINYKAIAPLKGPKGIQTSAIEYKSDFNNCEFVITNKCRDPEIAIRLGDYFFNYETTLNCWYGPEGKLWRFIEPVKGGGIDGESDAFWEFGIGNLPDSLMNYAWVQKAPLNTCTEFHYGRLLKDADTSSEYKYINALNLQKPFVLPRSSYAINMVIPSDIRTKIIDLETSIKDYVYEMQGRFITGNVNIDNDWVNYVETLKKMGLQDYIDNYQKIYDHNKK